MQQHSKNQMTPQAATPREYQLQAVQFAIAQNAIVFLPTGTGKTLIGSLTAEFLLTQQADAKKASTIPTPKRVAVFLCPTAQLVEQQQNSIETTTGLATKFIHGQMGTSSSDWCKSEWMELMEEYEIFVCTPAVFLGMLCHGWVTMSQILLLVFDECHHVNKGDLYAQIMKYFYHRTPRTQRPRVLGLTAALVKTKQSNASDVAQVVQMVASVATILDSQLFFCNDRSLGEYVNTPDIREQLYDSCAVDTSDLDKIWPTQPPLSLGGDDKLTKRWTRTRLVVEDLATSCGMWAVRELFRVFSAGQNTSQSGRAPPATDIAEIEDLWQPDSHPFNEQIRRAHQFLEDHIAERHESFVGDKLLKLKNLLRDHLQHDVSAKAIVFAQRRTTAMIVQRFLRDRGVACGLAVGVQGKSSNIQLTASALKQTVAQFRVAAQTSPEPAPNRTSVTWDQDRLDVMVSTAVLREGIDVSQCNLVINFDDVQTPCQDIQSEGRARKQGASHIHLVSRQQSDERRAQIQAMRQFRDTLKRVGELMHQQPTSFRTNTRVTSEEDDSIFIAETGACVPEPLAFDFVWRIYISFNRVDNSIVSHTEDGVPLTTEKNVIFSWSATGLSTCTLILPRLANTSAVVEPMEITGNPANSQKEAKSKAGVAVLRKLLELGALDNHLRVVGRTTPKAKVAASLTSPSTKTSGDDKIILTAPQRIAAEFKLPPTTSTPSQFTLHIHELRCLKTATNSPSLSGLALAMANPIMQPVQINLFLDKDRPPTVFTVLPCCSRLEVTQQQFVVLRQSHQRLVRLIRRTSTTLEETDELDTPFYLILPACAASEQGQNQTGVQINFAEAEKLANGPTPLMSVTTNRSLREWLRREDPVLINRFQTFVNTGVSESNAFTKAHQGGLEIDWKTWFETKGVRVENPNAALLMGMPLENDIKNYLGPTEAELLSSVGKQSTGILFPVDNTLVFGIRSCALQMAVCLPCVLWKLQHVLLVREFNNMHLREMAGIQHVDEALLIEALTCGSAAEGTNYQQLEWLGDAVLKCLACTHAFADAPYAGEGELTAKATQFQTNEFLCGICKEYEIYQYANALCFSRRRWVPSAFRSSAIPDKHEFSSKMLADLVEAIIGAIFATKASSTNMLSRLRNVNQFCHIFLGTPRGWPKQLVRTTQTPPRCRQLAASAVETLQRCLNHSFTQPSLLAQALTHPSMSSECTYEQLEFVGDAVLGMLVTADLFSRFHGQLDEGDLTMIKLKVVCNDSLANRLVMRMQKAGQRISQFVAASPTVINAIREFEDNPDARTPPKHVADVFEALVGAVFVDSGFDLDVVWRVFEADLQPDVQDSKQVMAKHVQLACHQELPVTHSPQADTQLIPLTTLRINSPANQSSPNPEFKSVLIPPQTGATHRSELIRVVSSGDQSKLDTYLTNNNPISALMELGQQLRFEPKFAYHVLPDLQDQWQTTCAIDLVDQAKFQFKATQRSKQAAKTECCVLALQWFTRQHEQ